MSRIIFQKEYLMFPVSAQMNQQTDAFQFPLSKIGKDSDISDNAILTVTSHLRFPEVSKSDS